MLKPLWSLDWLLIILALAEASGSSGLRGFPLTRPLGPLGRVSEVLVGHFLFDCIGA